MSTNHNTAPYGVLKSGPKCWYVQARVNDGEFVAGNIVGITFATRRGAVAAAASRNEVRGYTGPVPVETAA